MSYVRYVETIEAEKNDYDPMMFKALKKSDLPNSFILIPIGNEFLALSQEAFKEALELGRRVAGIANPATDPKPIERLFDAEEASNVTGIAASWFLEAARQGRIPHIKAGKYVRFRMSDVLQALEIKAG